MAEIEDCGQTLTKEQESVRLLLPVLRAQSSGECRKLNFKPVSVVACIPSAPDLTFGSWIACVRFTSLWEPPCLTYWG